MRAEKQVLRSRIRETEEANAEAVRAMKAAQDKNITKLRQEFRVNIEQLRTKCAAGSGRGGRVQAHLLSCSHCSPPCCCCRYEQRLQQLRDDLRLRHKVEVHEVEERKNLHINQLMKVRDGRGEEGRLRRHCPIDPPTSLPAPASLPLRRTRTPSQR